VVNSEQIRFHQNGRVEGDGPLSQARYLICSEGSLLVGMLFGVRPTHASDFGIEAEVIQLIVLYVFSLVSKEK